MYLSFSKQTKFPPELSNLGFKDSSWVNDELASVYSEKRKLVVYIRPDVGCVECNTHIDGERVPKFQLQSIDPWKDLFYTDSIDDLIQWIESNYPPDEEGV